jgi:hypothetical protein
MSAALWRARSGATDMNFINAIFTVLSCVPLILAVLFREALLGDKEKGLIDELKSLNALNISLVQSWGGEEGVRKQMQGYYSRTGLLVPAVLLSLLYGLGFLVEADFAKLALNGGTNRFFSREFLLAARPVLAAFLGVYLFNLGASLRRLFVSDMTRHVFWGSIYRLLLTCGLAVIISSAYKLGEKPDHSFGRYEYFVFFSIGFLANVFLRFVMDTAMRVGNIGKPLAKDLSVQMVEGINIWKEYRLEEEGIDNIQNLATTDPIDLAVKTHFPLRTLVDWIDQAVLIDRLGDRAAILKSQALIKGAIDLAWKSPENSGGNTATAKLLAEAIGVRPEFMEDLMDSLYEDAHVEALWALWQTRDETKNKGVFRYQLQIPAEKKVSE